MYKTIVTYTDTDNRTTLMILNGNLMNHLPTRDSSITVDGKDYTITNIVHDYLRIDESISICIYCSAE